MSHNQSEREVRDSRDDTGQQPGNSSLNSSQSSLSVNNNMSSYQASVEFDFNWESSNSDLSETAEVIGTSESAILEESNAFDSEPKGPYMDEMGRCGCRCGNCSLKRLQNAGGCLCFQELKKVENCVAFNFREVETTPRSLT